MMSSKTKPTILHLMSNSSNNKRYNNNKYHAYLTTSSILQIIIISIITTAVLTTTAPPTPKTKPYTIPSITLSDLRSHRYDSTFTKSLSTVGLLSITLSDDESRTTHRQNALGGLCQCLSNNDQQQQQQHTTTSSSLPLSTIPNSDMTLLRDGLTTRTSIATMTTVNDVVIPLPTSSIDEACRRSTSTTLLSSSLGESMESLRDEVHEVSRAFVTRLDESWEREREREEEGVGVLLRDVNGKEYKSFRSIVDGATHLEHFHVYSSSSSTVSSNETISTTSGSPTTTSSSSSSSLASIDDALELHTDAGFFLTFIPALSCSSNNDYNNDDDDNNNNVDSSFMVRVDGELRTVSFPSPDRSVVIMMGIGAQEWLMLNEKKKTTKQQYHRLASSFRATEHTVRMTTMSSRAWYGMMHLVPANAIIQYTPRKATFTDMRRSMVNTRDPQRTFSDTNPSSSSSDDITIGCGTTTTTTTIVPTSPSRHRRRRLQMVPDASHCDNTTNFYCWMSCLSIPDTEHASAHVSNGESLYCADHDKLSSDHADDLTKAVTDCEDPNTGVPGGGMNTNCMGVWHETVEGVPFQEVIIIPGDDDDDDGSENDYTDDTAYCHSGTSMFMNGFEWNSLVCVIYLFPSWVLNTRAKFVAASLGTVVLGIMVEGIISARRVLLKRFLGRPKLMLGVSTMIYGVQLTLAYFIMLVVMTYAVQLFLSSVIGLMLGHLIFQWLAMRQQAAAAVGANGASSSSEAMIPEGATPCCQNEMLVLAGGGSAAKVRARNNSLHSTSTTEKNDCLCAEEFDIAVGVPPEAVGADDSDDDSDIIIDCCKGHK